MYIMYHNFQDMFFIARERMIKLIIKNYFDIFKDIYKLIDAAKLKQTLLIGRKKKAYRRRILLSVY